MSESANKTSLDLSKIKKLFSKLHPYIGLMLVIFLVIVYSYVFLSIHGLSNEQPTTAQVNSYLKTTPTAVINPNIVNQLNQLKDTSVSVQALFNQARQNPFN